MSRCGCVGNPGPAQMRSSLMTRSERKPMCRWSLMGILISNQPTRKMPYFKGFECAKAAVAVLAHSHTGHVLRW